MEFPIPFISDHLVRRYKRFLADCVVPHQVLEHGIVDGVGDFHGGLPVSLVPEFSRDWGERRLL